MHFAFIATVTVCFVLFIGTPLVETVTTGKRITDLKPILSGLTGTSGRMFDCWNPERLLLEGYGLYYSTLIDFPVAPYTTEEIKEHLLKPKGTQPDLDKPTSIGIVNQTGNGGGAVFALFLRWLLGEQVAFFVVREPTDLEWNAIIKKQNEYPADANNKRNTVLNQVTQLLTFMEDRGVPVHRQDNSPGNDNVNTSFEADFEKFNGYTNILFVFDAINGKGQVGEAIESKAYRGLKLLKNLKKNSAQIWGVDGPSFHLILSYPGDDLKIQEDMVERVTKSDFVTLFYGFNGSEKDFWNTPAGKTFLITTEAVNTAVVKKAIPNHEEVEHTPYLVKFNNKQDPSAPKMQDAIYKNFDELQRLSYFLSAESLDTIV